MPESASETAHPPDPELRREQQHLADIVPFQRLADRAVTCR